MGPDNLFWGESLSCAHRMLSLSPALYPLDTSAVTAKMSSSIARCLPGEQNRSWLRPTALSHDSVEQFTLLDLMLLIRSLGLSSGRLSSELCSARAKGHGGGHRPSCSLPNPEYLAQNRKPISICGIPEKSLSKEANLKCHLSERPHLPSG